MTAYVPPGTDTHPRFRFPSRILLGLGYIALTAAVSLAHAHPARGYEPSIYLATPLPFWVALGTALCVAVLLSLSSRVGDDALATYGPFLLAFGCLLTLVGLPLLRGYHFYGSGDALTHLGWTRDVGTGALDPMGILYPALHLTALWLGELTGLKLNLSLGTVVTLYFAVFLLAVPLCVRTVVSDDRAPLIGLLVAGLFLPINDVSVFRMAHPFSLATMFLPVPLYFLLRYVESAEDGWLGTDVSAFGSALVVTSVALVVVHPQLGVAWIAGLGLIVALQHLARAIRPGTPLARNRSPIVQTALLGLFYLVWTSNKPTITGTVSYVAESLLAGPQVGSAISQRTGSMSEIGVDPVVLALKLFGPSLAIALLAGPLVLWALTALYRGDRHQGATHVTYLAATTVPLAGGFALFLALSISKLHFRFLGGIMAVVTVLGAIAITYGFGLAARQLGSVSARTAVVVLFAVLLPLSAATVFTSPFILRGSSHVPEQRIEGYRTTFEFRDSDTGFVGVRSGSTRYVHAVYGTEASKSIDIRGRRARVPPPVFETNLSTHYDGARYLPVSRGTVYTEVHVFGGLRYSNAGFRSLATTPGIDQVQHNGNYRLYRLR